MPINFPPGEIHNNRDPYKGHIATSCEHIANGCVCIATSCVRIAKTLVCIASSCVCIANGFVSIATSCDLCVRCKDFCVHRHKLQAHCQRFHVHRHKLSAYCRWFCMHCPLSQPPKSISLSTEYTVEVILKIIVVNSKRKTIHDKKMWNFANVFD